MKEFLPTRFRYSDMEFEFTQEFAQKLDDQDSLSSFRELFHYPDLHESQTLYFAGNSLGLQPRSTREYLGIELDSWKELAVEGHFHGKNPWFHYHKFSKDSLAKLTGARPTEVVALNNLTSNLHFLMVSFYRPTADRFRIITESDAFPSDQYALESQVRSHGFDPDEAIIEVAPESGKYTLETSKIVDAIKEYGQSTALVLFSGVQYYTGQFFDIAAITEAGQESGAYVGFDLAHAIGNVPLNLHEDGPDFATWCSYKYLNSGPGAVSGIFVHDRHSRKPGLPRFAGWWGHDEESRFRMEKGFVPMEGADGWQVSNVNILSSAALRASLDIYDKAGINNLREKKYSVDGLPGVYAQ